MSKPRRKRYFMLENHPGLEDIGLLGGELTELSDRDYRRIVATAEQLVRAFDTEMPRKPTETIAFQELEKALQARQDQPS